MHPIDARMAGRVVRVTLPVGAAVKEGDVLVELEADAERLALEQSRARLDALDPEIASIRREIAAEERAIDDERRSAAGARDEQRTRESDRLVRIQRLRGTLSRLEGERGTSAAAVKRFEYEVERRVLRAPVAGRIGEAVDLKTGAAVREGERLAAIVPDGPLRVVAQFAPAAAFGRVFSGQPATVRLEGFPWAEYGSLRARVTRVANEMRDGLVRVELEVTGTPPALPISHA